jgi:hypothetical protein
VSRFSLLLTLCLYRCCGCFHCDHWGHEANKISKDNPEWRMKIKLIDCIEQEWSQRVGREQP